MDPQLGIQFLPPSLEKPTYLFTRHFLWKLTVRHVLFVLLFPHIFYPSAFEILAFLKLLIIMYSEISPQIWMMHSQIILSSGFLVFLFSVRLCSRSAVLSQLNLCTQSLNSLFSGTHTCRRCGLHFSGCEEFLSSGI